MAMSIIWTAMVLVSLAFGAISGRLDTVASAAMEGAGNAVDLCFSMAGVMCLWSGVMEIMDRSGITAGLSALFRPILRFLLPEASRDSETLSAVSACVSANLLGLGSAATPLGIRAACRMARNCDSIASDDLCMLVVLNTASIQLIPATVAGVRAAAGSQAPFDILPAVWLSSVLSVVAGITAARLLSKVGTIPIRLRQPQKTRRDNAWI